MNRKTVAAVTSRLVFLLASLMCLPLGLGLFDRDMSAVAAYGVAALLTTVVAVLLALIGRGASEVLHRKDAMGIVALTWLITGVLGGLPFVFEGSITNPVSATFEAVSGFTTTGATVVADVDALSRPTHFWRCLSHWVGGMGIIVLFVAVFPQLGVGAKHLFRTEVAGPITEGLRPRIKHTALVLWWIYAAFTALATGLLFLAGMPLFDSICHAFSTVGTAGFSTKTASIGHYDSQWVDWIVIGFMLIGGINFGLYYSAISGRFRELWRNYEVRFFLLVNAVVAGIIWYLTRGDRAELTDLRYAIFQTVSVTTTTGFMTEDFDAYPDVARFLLFLCMFMGGCAGSTAGGLKASRVYALFVLAAREVRASIQPQSVIAVRMGRNALPPSVIYGILVFVTTFLVLFALASIVLVVLGLDLVSAMSASIACLSSVGPGLGQVGPLQSYEAIPDVGKLILCFCMIAGRLEIFALLAVFSPECWRR